MGGPTSHAVAAFVPAPREPVLHHLAAEPGRLIVVAAARQPEAHCPVCGYASRRVHGRYERCLAELPWHRLGVMLRVSVHRFGCEVPACPRRLFCERLPQTAAPSARRTLRLESFNGRLRDECLNEQWFTSLVDAERSIEHWRRDYNARRPHSSLGWRPPRELLLRCTSSCPSPDP